MEQTEISCIRQKLEKKRKKEQQEIFQEPSENQQLGLMRLKSQINTFEIGDGLGAVNHDSERIRMEFVEDLQEETESKKLKWEKAH